MTTIACLVAQTWRGAPEAVRALVWEVFFASLGRGVSLDVHMPWLADAERTLCIALAETDDAQPALAALAIREIDLPPVGRVGLTGLVCVRADRRGQGLSTRLLAEAEAEARRAGLVALLLWTGKPDVYAKVGYQVDQVEQVVRVTRPDAALASTDFRCEAQSLPLGLPPFAAGALSCSSAAASLTVLTGPQGHTLAAWTGPWDEIFALLAAALPSQWQFNAGADDELLHQLAQRGWGLEASPGAVRMRRDLTSLSLPAIPPLPLLSRV